MDSIMDRGFRGNRRNLALRAGLVTAAVAAGFLAVKYGPQAFEYCNDFLYGFSSRLEKEIRSFYNMR